MEDRGALALSDARLVLSGFILLRNAHRTHVRKCGGARPGRHTGEMPEAESDAELATRLAVETGKLLVEAREQLWEDGAHHWDVMDAGDDIGHRYIAKELARLRPDDAVLDEEGKEDPRRFDADRCWIIDPLDGTREYGEPGRHDWAVHVALWDRDHFEAGAVSLPAVDVVLATDPAPELPEFTRERPRIITSRYRAPYAAVIVANELGCDAVRLGSAGAKAMAVVMGEADIYLHDGGMYQWDSAAPVAVAEAAGLPHEPGRRQPDRLQRAQRLAPRRADLPQGTRRRRPHRPLGRQPPSAVASPLMDDQHAELAHLVGERCRLTDEFELRSGQTSTTYFDKYRFEGDPALLGRIAERMIPVIPDGTEVLAGLELGGVPVATALSLATGLPAAFVRKQAKSYGTARLAEGADIEGRRVLVIEDVITTGGQVAESTAELRALGAQIETVLCVIDRSRGDHARLDAIGVGIVALFRGDELLAT